MHIRHVSVVIGLRGLHREALFGQRVGITSLPILPC